MKVLHQNPDRISTLPQDIIEKILTCMPIRDALRTSILSRKWRYCWASMPKLVFYENLVTGSFNNGEIDKYKLVNAILHILLLHKGPILEFIMHMDFTDIFNEFDQIILHLSRSNNLKKFIFQFWSPDSHYKLPSCFFSLHGLEHLDLTYCVFEPPLLFDGFSMLRKLRFDNVDITTKTLLQLLTNCPLLEKFTLIGDPKDFIGENKCTFVDLFECLPPIQVLELRPDVLLNLIVLSHAKILCFNPCFGIWLKLFAVHGTPQMLPTSLVRLKILVLEVCFLELSSTLFVINNSPNLEKIQVKICRGEDWCVEQTFTNLLDLQVYSGLNLDRLKELEITNCCISALEMAFVKLIMANSPLLKIARIELSTYVSNEKEVQMLRDLLQLPFPRASPTAKFIIEPPF